MVNYKESEFLEFIPDVKVCKSNISALNEQWDNIKLLCEINCPVQSKKIIPNITKIQNSFYDLQDKLIGSLIYESLNKLNQKTVSKAQVAVDILIRNLYERTADVGFIATDHDICKFVYSQDRSEAYRQIIVDRLRQYVLKYSVYHEIIILDANFNVLVNLDQGNPIADCRIQDEVLEQAASSNQGFLEYFGPSPLLPKVKNAHIFLSRIYDHTGSRVEGIICLCFKFENELEMIFDKLSGDYDGSVILIVDNKNKVIASSDETHVPTGIKVEVAEGDSNCIAYYRGIEYIVKTVQTKGYQGYFGLGWKGQVMIPLGLAFKDNTAAALENAHVEGLIKKADYFSEDLHNIMQNALKINHSLRQIVFNGEIFSQDNILNDEHIRLKPILSKIARMGSATSQLFETSIKNLFLTLISTSLRNVSFLASLCIDIMDRNLYERANDCRWWALNSAFKSILAKPEVSAEDNQKLTKILSYINSLYTVYENLFLFDKNKKIIAVSNPSHSDDIGKELPQEFIRYVLDNFNSEKYYVSPWEQSELYSGEHTYIYGASVTDIDVSTKTIGGIGIVFDSTFQLKTMLSDAIGKSSTSFAVFTDAYGHIISSTDDSLITGQKLNVPSRMFEAQNGMSNSEIIVYNGCYYALGYACSSGYREYKISDGYKNDVFAFVFEKLADFEQDVSLKVSGFDIEHSDFNYSDNETHIKFVTFKINKQLFALEQSVVLEALEAGNVISLPMEGIVKAAVLYNNKYIGVIDPDDLFSISTKGEYSHVLILEPLKDKFIALKVEELNIIIEISESEIKAVGGFSGKDSIVSGVISIKGDDSRSVLILNHEKIQKIIEGISFCEPIIPQDIFGG